MTDPIVEYLQWKKQGGELRAKAKQAIEARFRELLTEAVHLAEEYRSDFGVTLTPPVSVTAFKFKAGAKKAVKKAPPVPAAAVPVIKKPDPKTAALEKQLTAARKKLEAAKANGASTKNLEDRVYELEDDLRLATQ